MVGLQPRILKVLFISAEADPFVKIGGLGDYAGSLPLAIKKAGETSHGDHIDIKVAIPYHRPINLSGYHIKKTWHFKVENRDGAASGFAHEVEKDGITFYFIRRAGNPAGYGNVYNLRQEDDAKKYLFFSLACIELLKEIDWYPDILHANDWHTAVSAKYLKERYVEVKPLYKTKSLLVIHNMPYMGQGSQKQLKKYNISPAKNIDFPDWAQNLPLPIGLDSADQISTVSPSYARELKTEEFAGGLENFFINNSSRFSGILNGIDTNKWNPDDDPFIFKTYSELDIENKKLNKLDLLATLGIRNRIDIPLFIMVARLTHQKGLDIIIKAIPNLTDENWTGIILGTGDPSYEKELVRIQKIMPDKLHVILDYNAPFAHTMYAGGDFFLMPSLYEPCGISQMIAMRYGCIPIANRVGGLIDTIKPSGSENQTGYLFPEATHQAFINSFKCGLADYHHPKKWRRIQLQAMREDFSWGKSAGEYINLYKKMLSSEDSRSFTY